MVVVTVKEAALLIAMHHVIGRVEVEDDLLWRYCVRRDELVDEQSIHVNRGLTLRAVFETAEGRGAGQRLIATDCRLQGDVMPELIMVVEIFFAATNSIDPLPEHLLNGMLHARLAPVIWNKPGSGAG